MMDDERRGRPRLAQAERRRQLFETATRIVREEGADRLTLGHLANQAGVSKPVVYDHFSTRSDLLIALYRWIDLERVAAFRTIMAEGKRSRQETIDTLAATFIACAADAGDEFHAVGAALAGSVEKARVYEELLDNVVEMFGAVLLPYLPQGSAQRRSCVALVGAGEALAAGAVRGIFPASEATATFTALIGAMLDEPNRRP